MAGRTAVLAGSTAVVEPFEAPPANRPGQAHLLLAELVYDTRQQALPTGVRLAGHRARRLLFRAGEYEISLQLSPRLQVGRFRLIGQLLRAGRPLSGAEIRLAGPVEALLPPTDPLGEFRLADLPAGVYRLEVESAGQRVALSALALDGVN